MMVCVRSVLPGNRVDSDLTFAMTGACTSVIVRMVPITLDATPPVTSALEISMRKFGLDGRLTAETSWSFTHSGSPCVLPCLASSSPSTNGVYFICDVDITLVFHATVTEFSEIFLNE